MNESESKLLAGGHFADHQGRIKPNIECQVRMALVYKLNQVLIRVSDTDDELFRMAEEIDDDEGMICTSLGHRFLSTLSLEVVEVFEVFFNCRFNPYFESFCSIAKKHGFFGKGDHLSVLRQTFQAELVSKLNDCVLELRQEYASKEFKQKLYDYRKSGTKNLRSLRDYFSQMFEAHARMLMVRVDLSYSKACVEAGDALHERVQRDRDMLINHVKSGVFGPLLGVVWKLERGVRRGLHYHMLFCFDANVVRADILIGIGVGQYWQKEVTNGKGVYYNCNAYKEKYPKPFLGQMHYTDKVAWEGLDQYLRYITVADDLLRLSLPHTRSLGRTGATRRATSRRGRPRKEEG
ncbi:YagK/YfjJ domain-containing protein [Pseudomonas sp. PS02302]|uniref:YagK/YfjJ domain-containing protein n=1 Tax=Pseudomonas sp. PS02302 TaxID=2991428 RepID=UPI00249A981C|nr:inovirus-type Gp2 protein [Pseudomonas sp. PS02302]